MTHGISAQGRKELKDFLQGKRLTASQSIKAKCYECMGRYEDGKVACLVTTCPLYPFHPYIPKLNKRQPSRGKSRIKSSSTP